jgi:hypothetical protein
LTRVFLPILEKLKLALDSSILHAEEEAKFFEVSVALALYTYLLSHFDINTILKESIPANF